MAGFLRNCYIKARSDRVWDKGNPLDLFREVGEDVICSLDGYAIIPRSEYEAMQSALEAAENQIKHIKMWAQQKTGGLSAQQMSEAVTRMCVDGLIEIQALKEK